MQEKCEWCDSEQIEEDFESVFWELPDGSRAIQIEKTPSVKCLDCNISYQSEKITKEIEDHLFLIDTKQIGKKINYGDLMKIPKLLKRNYFDFTK